MAQAEGTTEERAARADRLARAFRRRCVECGRVFDLLAERDAEEWESGHDCEVPE